MKILEFLKAKDLTFSYLLYLWYMKYARKIERLEPSDFSERKN